MSYVETFPSGGVETFFLSMCGWKDCICSAKCYNLFKILKQNFAWSFQFYFNQVILKINTHTSDFLYLKTWEKSKERYICVTLVKSDKILKEKKIYIIDAISFASLGCRLKKTHLFSFW